MSSVMQYQDRHGVAADDGDRARHRDPHCSDKAVHDSSARSRSMDDAIADYRQRWRHWQTQRHDKLLNAPHAVQVRQHDNTHPPPPAAADTMRASNAERQNQIDAMNRDKSTHYSPSSSSPRTNPPATTGVECVNGLYHHARQLVRRVSQRWLGVIFRNRHTHTFSSSASHPLTNDAPTTRTKNHADTFSTTTTAANNNTTNMYEDESFGAGNRERVTTDTNGQNPVPATSFTSSSIVVSSVSPDTAVQITVPACVSRSIPSQVLHQQRQRQGTAEQDVLRLERSLHHLVDCHRNYCSALGNDDRNKHSTASIGGENTTQIYERKSAKVIDSSSCCRNSSDMSMLAPVDSDSTARLPRDSLLHTHVHTEEDVWLRHMYDEVVREMCESTVRHAIRRRLDSAHGATERALTESVVELVLRACYAHNSNSSSDNDDDVDDEDHCGGDSSHNHENTASINHASMQQETSCYDGKQHTTCRRCTTGVLAHIQSGQPVVLSHLCPDAEDNRVMARILQNRSSDAAAVTLSSGGGGFSMSYAHLATLRAGCWLNDQVINLYLELLCVSASQGDAASLGTHFYAKVETELQRLRAIGHTTTTRAASMPVAAEDSDEDTEEEKLPSLPANSALLRWLRRRTHLLADCTHDDLCIRRNTGDSASSNKGGDSANNGKNNNHTSTTPPARVVLIPVNLSAQHWALVVWNKELHTLYYYDSLCGIPSSCSGSRSTTTAADTDTARMPQACTVGYRRAQRILRELAHVLYECRRHLLFGAAQASAMTVCSNSNTSDTNISHSPENNAIRPDALNCREGSHASTNWLRFVVAMPYTSWRDSSAFHEYSPSNTTPCYSWLIKEEHNNTTAYAPYTSREAMHTAEEDFRTRLCEHDRYVAEYRSQHRRRRVRGRPLPTTERSSDAYALCKAMRSDNIAHEGVPVCGVAGMSMAEAEVDWFVDGFAKTAQQQNGSDCGVFVCQTAWCAVQGVAVDYAQCDIPLLRQVIMLELWSRKLLRRLRCHHTPSSVNI